MNIIKSYITHVLVEVTKQGLIELFRAQHYYVEEQAKAYREWNPKGNYQVLELSN